MLEAARKPYLTNILLCISALFWQILTGTGPQQLNVTAMNKYLQNEAPLLWPQRDFCMHVCSRDHTRA